MMNMRQTFAVVFLLHAIPSTFEEYVEDDSKLAFTESQIRDEIQLIEKEIRDVWIERNFTEKEIFGGLSMSRMMCIPTREKKPNCREYDPQAFAKQKSILNMYNNGRLGNQMSITATMIAEADLLGLSPYLYEEQANILGKVFDIHIPVLEDSFCQVCALPWENVNGYKIENMHLLGTGHAFSLATYAQSPSIYKEYLNDIKNQVFTFKNPILNMAKEDISKAIDSSDIMNPILIGIHARRTDMSVHLRNYNGTLVPASYFLKAKKYFLNKFGKGKILFILVSDDKDWSAENLIGQYEGDTTVFLGHLEGKYEDGIEPHGVDLAILSLCDHVILSHGTFGIWGGLLAGGEVIMAEKYSERTVEEIFYMKQAQIEGWTFMSP